MVVYWIRNDLRLHDNQALASAARLAHEQRLPLLALFVAPDGWSSDGYQGIPRFSARRHIFWKEAWETFAEGIANRYPDASVGAEWQEDALEVLQKRHAQTPIRAVFCTAAFSWNEVQQEAKVASWCMESGIEFRAVENHDLFSPGDLPFSLDNLPPTFTPFRHAVEAKSRVAEPLACHGSKSAQQRISTVRADERSCFPWHGGEPSALARVRCYIWESDHVARYKDTRNGLVGTEFSSKLSPWLATGALSARHVWHEILRYEAERGAGDGPYWLRFELLWRSYFLWNARLRGRSLFAAAGWKTARAVTGRPTAGSLEAFNRWTHGCTGDPLVDAAMRELVATGFLSNRARQNAASFLIHDLQGDWRAGAAFFEQHLLDYEAASNWGNWAYIAGVGNDPRPTRVFNTVKQAEQYDPAGEYRRLWAQPGIES